MTLPGSAPSSPWPPTSAASTPRCAAGRSRRATGPRRVVGAVAATLLAVGDAFAGEPPADLEARIADVADDELGALAEPAMAISWGLLALDRLPQGLAAARRIAAASRRAATGWHRSRTISPPCSRSGCSGASPRPSPPRTPPSRPRAGQRERAARAVGAVDERVGADGARAARRRARRGDGERRAGAGPRRLGVGDRRSSRPRRGSRRAGRSHGRPAARRRV